MKLNHQSGTTLQQELYTDQITLGIVKPHAYRRRREIGCMIKNHRYEVEGLDGEQKLVIIARKAPFRIPESIAHLHYQIHQGKPFYEKLVRMMSVGSAELLVISGPNAVQELSSLTGATDPREAAEGTIRRRFGNKKGWIMYNAFHRSDSQKEARREIYLYFDKSELPDRVVELLDDL